MALYNDVLIPRTEVSAAVARRELAEGKSVEFAAPGTVKRLRRGQLSRRSDVAHEPCEPGLGDVVVPNLLDHGVFAPPLHRPLGFIIIV